ncbi:MAG: lactoylglutathione lyase [Undibacterium sp.]|uniref:lactoylglutathione lyase n=1 Tax=Undibacterium sp. TaxID=1914977 RepID=UPI002715C947|nr:lactoylglutathione lyase [Undibacterium sp.]MDO8654527.1 lactoylglutathione lyase [Undibacterium sp.]
MRLLHTMLRVGNLERSLAFYTQKLGMTLLRKEKYPAGRFTLAFVGYGDEHSTAVIELTHNWDKNAYEHGDAFGHIALAVYDLKSMCVNLEAAGVKVIRQPGPMSVHSPNRTTIEHIAFIEDPDHYRIELIELKTCKEAAKK